MNPTILFVAKKKESYRSLLDEHKDLPLDATFKDIRRKIQDDPRYTKYSSSDKKCEKEFNSWVSRFDCCNLFWFNLNYSRPEIGFPQPGMSTNNFSWRLS